MRNLHQKLTKSKILEENLLNHKLSSRYARPRGLYTHINPSFSVFISYILYAPIIIHSLMTHPSIHPSIIHLPIHPSICPTIRQLISNKRKMSSVTIFCHFQIKFVGVFCYMFYLIYSMLVRNDMNQIGHIRGALPLNGLTLGVLFRGDSGMTIAPAVEF